jgi:hypothetical protein
MDRIADNNDQNGNVKKENTAPMLYSLTPERNAVIAEFVETGNGIAIVVHIECKDTEMLTRLQDYAQRLLHGMGK